MDWLVFVKFIVGNTPRSQLFGGSQPFGYRGIFERWKLGFLEVTACVNLEVALWRYFNLVPR